MFSKEMRLFKENLFLKMLLQEKPVKKRMLSQEWGKAT